MFTGIIEATGKIKNLNKTSESLELTIETSKGFSGVSVKIGDSIAINGTCLTVTKKTTPGVGSVDLVFDVIYETYKRTTLSGLRVGAVVNLEQALKADSRLGGHFVSGHIDCVGKVVNRKNEKGQVALAVKIPAEFSNLLIEKGSIAIDGISLTIGEVKKDNFTVYLIPHTLKETTLQDKKVGDEVNIEIDQIAKYTYKFNSSNPSQKSPITSSFLKKHGF